MNTPPFPMVISAGELSLPAAAKGHVDPYVADLVSKANILLRKGLDDPTQAREMKSHLAKLLKYSGEGIVSRWFTIRKFIKAIEQGKQEKMYVSIIAQVFPGVHCDIGILAMPYPYPVHGCDHFHKIEN